MSFSRKKEVAIPTPRESLVNICEYTLLNDIGKSARSIKSVFSCGGSVALEPEKLSVFYTSRRSKTTGVLYFPFTDDDLKGLLGVCEPATFGKGDKDVLDTTYRKALKLDSNSFATNFEPAKFGIIDQ